MKKYKVLQVGSAAAFETALNELAQSGWKVVSANIAYQGLQSDEAGFFALLVNNDTDTLLKELLEENTDAINNPDQVGIAPSDN